MRPTRKGRRSRTSHRPRRRPNRRRPSQRRRPRAPVTAAGQLAGRRPPDPLPSPTPPRRYVRPASPAQMRKMMAQCAQVWPAEPGQSATEVDEERRANLLALCDAVGAPGLTSRTEISFALAQVVLDALNALEEGRVVLANGLLYDAETGERLAEGPQR